MEKMRIGEFEIPVKKVKYSLPEKLEESVLPWAKEKNSQLNLSQKKNS